MLRFKRGQVRILEALLTCMILLIGLSAAVYFGGVYESVETGELEEVGQNILSILDDSEVIDEIVFGEEGVDELKTLIETLLPPDTFYSVRVSSALTNETIREVSNIVGQNFSSVADTVALRQVKTISLPVARRELTKLDVMLVIDRSGSMGWEDPPRIYYAKEAAKTFVDQLNASRDRVGLASFATEASLDHHLSNNFDSVKSEIDSLQANGWTKMGGGLEEANAELNSSHRDDAILAMILLSDGMANVDRDGNIYEDEENREPAMSYVREEANEAGNMSVVLYTIGLGNDTEHFDEELLRSIVKNGGHYYYAPSAEDLEDIYEKIALDLLFQVRYDIVVIEITLVKAG